MNLSLSCGPNGAFVTRHALTGHDIVSLPSRQKTGLWRIAHRHCGSPLEVGDFREPETRPTV
jgi:hypothetical protein